MYRLIVVLAALILNNSLVAQEPVTKGTLSFVLHKNMHYISLNKKKETLATTALWFNNSILKLEKEIFNNKLITSIQKKGKTKPFITLLIKKNS